MGVKVGVGGWGFQIGGGPGSGGGGVRIQEGWIHASAHLRPASAGMTGGDDEGG